MQTAIVSPGNCTNEDKKLRTVWDAEQKKWYILTVDINCCFNR
jgi:hypothetical protein